MVLFYQDRSKSLEALSCLEVGTKNGPVPPHHIITFADGNTLNLLDENLMLMSKADNARRNAPHKNLPDSYVSYLLAGRNNNELREELLKHPDLLEAERLRLLLRKTIKKLKNGQRKAA
jgi:hypothetical protein